MLRHRRDPVCVSTRQCVMMDRTTLAATTVWGLLLATASFPPYARVQTLQGRVIDEGSETPTPSAVVTLLDREGNRRAEAVTDSLGRFRLSPQEAGEYVLQAVQFGYETGARPSWP